MIEINTSSVQGELLRDRADFKTEVEKATNFFNSAKFDEKARASVVFHEGCHLFYTREAAVPFGGFEPRIYGPAVEYSKARDEFYPSVGAVQCLPKEIRMKADPIAVAKSFLGPLFVMKKLHISDSEHLLVSPDNDVENFELWCKERFPNDSLEFRVSLWIQVEDSIDNDLKNQVFVKKIWDAAKEFEQRVFGPVN